MLPSFNTIFLFYLHTASQNIVLIAPNRSKYKANLICKIIKFTLVQFIMKKSKLKRSAQRLLCPMPCRSGRQLFHHENVIAENWLKQKHQKKENKNNINNTLFPFHAVSTTVARCGQQQQHFKLLLSGHMWSSLQVLPWAMLSKRLGHHAAFAAQHQLP